MALDGFSAPVREWFATSFPAPTPAQEQGWPAIAGGDHTLILAPTGSGKTLAAFLWGLDRLSAEPPPDERTTRTRLLYISPLRALAVDVERNLRAPLAGIALAAERLGHPVKVPTVGMRTGDTAADERRALVRHPPDVLITTPESLFLMLTSRARETLAGVRWVIVDEIHALAATKRGAHLSLSLERLEHLVVGAGGVAPQRVGLSATQRPLDEIARFLGGRDTSSEGWRPVTIVDAGRRKAMEVEVVVPVEDLSRMGEILEEPVSGPTAAGPSRASIWPSVHPKLLELIHSHRSTLVFVNSRRLAERLAARLNELDAQDPSGDDPPGGPDRGARHTGDEQMGTGGELVRAHHGSLSREQRLDIEDQLKAGRLRALVATSSLELGIDMGAIDLVVQVESPGSVASGLQRIGRAGHRVGEPSRGKVFPKHRGDLVEAAVVVRRMGEGLIEETRYPRNPLDVLAQQIVAACALDEWRVDDLAALVRRSANFADLSPDALASVLDLLAGRYPSEEFAELRPRIVWDRQAGVVRGRSGAQRVAVTNAGTIPDRGLFGVFLPDGARVGELDEEMVYESRVGETFLLGASTWRITEIGFDRVVVVPAPGEPGKMPFWHGDKPGRPLELGRAIGAFVREVAASLAAGGGESGAGRAAAAVEALQANYALDPWAADNLVRYVADQVEATGVVPDDRTVVVERFRDEIGDWRICILSPFGARVHAPWAMALEARLASKLGMDVQTIWSDDGIVLRLPEAEDHIPLDEVALDPDEVEELVIAALPGTALFAARFRENAARSLLLPRRRPGSRTPLWQQRQRAADLLRVAARYPSFPLLLETTRECLADVFDLPALTSVLTDLRSGRARVVAVDTEQASPFASSLLFGWVAVYMYEGDAPLAERRAAALALDRDLLRELLGAEELRELIDPAALADLELELQCLVEGRLARDADEAHDLLRRLGPLSLEELAARSARSARPARSPLSPDGSGPTSGPQQDHFRGQNGEIGDAGDRVAAWVEELVEARRAIRVGVGGEARVAAAEDAARLRDGFGVPVPPGLPAAFLEPVERPLDQLVGRFARTTGPFHAADAARRLGAPLERVDQALARLADDGRIVLGEFRPGGSRREWCDTEVLRMLRRRSLAALRREVEPVDAVTLGRFLPAWHGVGRRRRGLDALLDAIARLQGLALPASVLEHDVLPTRVEGFRHADLDQLCSAGAVVWLGAGRLGASDGRVALYRRDQVALLAPPPRPGDERPADEVHEALRHHLGARGASFWPDLLRDSGRADERVVLDALWDLVWAGEVTNDGLAPLRAVLESPGRRRRRGARPRPGSLSRLGPPAGAGRWSLVAPLLEPAPTPTERAHARAVALLERHGVVAREAVLAEGAEGGFAGVYGVLKAMEEAGSVRRGYFVAGLGAAQFALPGAVDRLRGERTPVDADLPEGDGRSGRPPLTLAPTDPANPYGAALAWPASEGRPARAAGAYVVLVDGEAAAYLERGGHSLLTFPAASRSPAWIDGLVALVKNGRLRRLVISRVDGAPVADSPVAEVLRGAGFVDGYRGLTLQ